METETVDNKLDNYIVIEETKKEIEQLNANMRELFKMVEGIQKSLDLIYNDRDLIKDVYAQGDSIRGMILALDKHNDNLTKDLKAEVMETKSKVEEKSEQVKDVVEFHTGNIAETIEKKAVIKIKEGKGFLHKLLKI